MASLPARLYGTDEPRASRHPVRVGAWSMHWCEGWLRDIRWGPHEIWRGVGLVLRDADWASPRPLLDRVDIRQSGEAFEIGAEGRFLIPAGAQDAGAEVAFRLSARGDARGGMQLETQTVATTDIRLNRLGLCLLHASEVASARVEVVHVDGRVSASTFPTLIPPWPPFTLVRTLRHEWRPGRWATATLEGDTFETEDQRNNADAAFKTYSRSNLAPRPYRLGAGMVRRQAVSLRLEGMAVAASAPNDHAAPPLCVTVGAEAGSWPAVGVEIDGSVGAPAAVGQTLEALAPAHLHLVWRPDTPVDWPAVGTWLATSCARLRLDLVLPDDTTEALPHLQALADALAAQRIEVDAVAVFPSRHAHVHAARRVFPGRPVGGGTPHFFVQLSRLDELGEVDFAAFTTASVVHGVAEEDVMDGLASLPALVDTWRARHPGVALRVGPSDIGARSSPLGAQPRSDGRRRVALAAVDPRSRAQFGAAWALGHVAGFARPGVVAITLMSLCASGRGLVGLEDGRVVQSPALQVLAALTGPAKRLDVEISSPRKIAAVALRREDGPCVLVANLGADVEVVSVAGLGPWDAYDCLDAGDEGPPRWQPRHAIDGRLELPAYAVARISPGLHGAAAPAR